MGQKKIWWLYFILSLALFIFNGFKKFQTDDIEQWRSQSCHWKELRDFHAPDCGMPLRKATLFASPYLKYQEKIECRPDSSHSLPEGKCIPTDPTLWRGPQIIPEIGWDAYSTWYLRASLLYFESQRPEWPGVGRALRDPTFLSSLPAKEHYKYPWGLSLLYYKILKLFKNPHPLSLQVLQVFIFLAASFLIFKTGSDLPLPLRLSLVLLPIGSSFIFKLYADVWILFWNALLILSLRKNIPILAFLAAFLAIQFKWEGIAHVSLILLSFGILKIYSKKQWESYQSFLCAIIGLILSKVLGALMSAHLPPDHFYTPLFSRLFDPESYTERLPTIFRYYLDVFFRPSLWLALWPLSLFIFFKIKGREKILFLPLLCLWFLIPLAYLSFPDGSFREVVLTGSNRALWQCLPLTVFLLNHFRNHLVFSKTREAGHA